jgi:hypothetical protein
MKRLIPFYTWIRKSTPLILEKTLEQPWKMAVVPKMNYAIAGAMGQDPQSISEPWPEDSDTMFPEWMKDTAGAQWFTHGDNPVMGAIPDPFSDFFAQSVQPGMAGILGSLTPALKLPVERFVRTSDDAPNGRQFFGDIPINDQTRWIDQQIPGVSKVGSLTNTSPVAGLLESLVGSPEQGTGFVRNTGTKDDPAENIGNLTALQSFFTGLGFQEATDARQDNAAYERRIAGADRTPAQEIARQTLAAQKAARGGR